MQVHGPSWRNTFDAGNLITLAAMLVAGAIAWGKMDANQTALQNWQSDRDRAYTERRNATDARFSAIETKIQPIDSMIYRLGKQESETAATNQRVDRVVDAFSDQLAALRKDVNSVGTKVEVLTQTIADQNKRHESQGMLLPRPND